MCVVLCVSSEESRKLSLVLCTVRDLRLEVSVKLEQLEEELQLTRSTVEDVGSNVLRMEKKLMQCTHHSRDSSWHVVATCPMQLLCRVIACGVAGRRHSSLGVSVYLSNPGTVQVSIRGSTSVCPGIFPLLCSNCR